MTIHNLLTHTAGLGYSYAGSLTEHYEKLGISDGLDLRNISLCENLRRIASAPLAFQPGSNWQYSLSLDVLGAVIEQVAGLPLEAAVRNLVTEPIGMLDSGFVSKSRERFAVPYYNSKTEREPVRMTDNNDVPMPDWLGGSIRFAPSRAFDPTAYPSGGGGMYGSADDVVRFLEVIRGNFDFLPQKLADAARRNHLHTDSAGPIPGWGFGYLGAVLVDPSATHTPQGAGTLQWGGVYGHSWFIDPTLGVTVLLLTNTAYEGMVGTLPIDLRNAIYSY